MSTKLSCEPTLSPLGLGCSRIGSFNNPQPLAESRALVSAAIDLGVTTIDTSNIYGQGDSEQQIGRALQGRRDQAFIVTKAGRGFSAKMRLLRPLKPILRPLLTRRDSSRTAVTAQRDDEMRVDWRPAHFAPSLEQSLRRLCTDRVDGFLLHSPPAAVAGDPAIGSALAALKAAGKVRHFGVSCDDRACLDQALTMPGLSLLQLPYNLIEEVETDGLAERIRERGILVLAREVIRLQPLLDPASAVRRASTQPIVSCTLVGTSSRKHLAALAATFA